MAGGLDFCVLGGRWDAGILGLREVLGAAVFVLWVDQSLRPMKSQPLDSCLGFLKVQRSASLIAVKGAGGHRLPRGEGA